jgi:hypothetical protein
VRGFSEKTRSDYIRNVRAFAAFVGRSPDTATAENGRARFRRMTLEPNEFIRRFLLHVLPNGFHRIRHYGLLASATCKANIARARELIATPLPSIDPSTEQNDPDVTVDAGADYRPPCPCCGGRMIIVESFGPSGAPRAPPSQAGIGTAMP